MTTLRLIGWKPGLNAVALIEAVRHQSRQPLLSAKRAVERFLDGETILLEFDTEESREIFRKKVESLGVNVKLASSTGSMQGSMGSDTIE